MDDFHMELLLYGIQSPINLGMILRTAEVYHFKVSILDLHGVLEDPQAATPLHDFACGAIGRRGFQRLQNVSAIGPLRSGRRLVATSIAAEAISLSEFQFRPDDLIVLGNEYDGLPDDALTRADALLRVPTPAGWLPKEKSYRPIDPSRSAPVARDGQPSLNVAVTAGILCFSAYTKWMARNGQQEVSGASSPKGV